MKVPFRRFIKICPVSSVSEVGENIFALSFRFPEIAGAVHPGQFINIRVADAHTPLFRRPFSVYRTTTESVEIIFNAIGRGTRILSRMKENDRVDILGPLGRGYGIDGSFDTAVLVAGGLGVAPLPILTDWLRRAGKRVVTLLGTRTRAQLVPAHLENVSTATEDGSDGFKGTVVDLLDIELRRGSFTRPKIFACGPNRMLQALSTLTASCGIASEVSLECTMACGFGICQGCPVERVGTTGAEEHHRRYSLVCKDGPVFDSNTIVIE